jgi:hypothetical protein
LPTPSYNYFTKMLGARVKTKLSYGKIEYGDYLDRHTETMIIADIMWAYGYEITDLDAYRAWLAGAEGVWEHPYDYQEHEVVECILSECFMEPHVIDDDEGFGAPEFTTEEMLVLYPQDIITDDEWDSIMQSLEEDLENYEAKSEPRPEGFKYPTPNSLDPLEDSIFN